jgi:hypothetical protein
VSVGALAARRQVQQARRSPVMTPVKAQPQARWVALQRSAAHGGRIGGR